MTKGLGDSMLETKRLIIRRLKKEDTPYVLAILNTDYANQYNITGPINEAIVWKMVEYSLSFVILLKDTNEMIGIVGVEKDYLRYNMKSVSLTYVLNQKYEGNGYMYEALKEIIYDIFTRLERKLISLRIANLNERSINLAKRLGFHYDGMIKMGTRKEDGTIYDDLLFTLTKKDFEENIEL
jgi:ribosomal-protein-alanine N-acetyltransferase